MVRVVRWAAALLILAALLLSLRPDDDAQARRGDARSIIGTIAGRGPLPRDLPQGGYYGDGAAATAALLDTPSGLAVDARGRVLIADSGNDRVRAVARNGTITTVAGSGRRGGRGNGGAATRAQLNSPTGVTALPAGGFLISDWGNHQVRQVRDGKITAIAGTGVAGFAGDGGPAVRARLQNPSRATVAPDGSVYIADTGNQRVRKVGPDGTIRTVAGTGEFGYSGDGGVATEAQLAAPVGVALGRDGRLFIADSGNNRVRVVSPSGRIATIAGVQTPSDAGPLDLPLDVLADGESVIVASASANRIVRVGGAGTVETIAGRAAGDYGGDGASARQARLRSPSALAAKRNELFVADTDNNTIRVISTRPRRLVIALRKREQQSRPGQKVRWRYYVSAKARVSAAVPGGASAGAIPRRAVGAAGMNDLTLRAPRVSGRHVVRFVARTGRRTAVAYAVWRVSG